MHTARQLNESLFTISIDGHPATRDDLFVEWGALHRFGIVVHDPFGAVGASYLLQLAITAFYDANPERRSRERPMYPDVFVFHVGGRLGDHTYFDVYPPRKEVFVEDDPALVLEALNDRGITHLAVPDRPVETVKHNWKEPAQGLDRLVAAWAYAPDGRPSDPDVTIVGAQPRTEANTKISLLSEQSYHERQQARAAIGAIVVTEDEILLEPESRQDEVPEEIRRQIWEDRQNLDGAEGRGERYRRIATSDALGMLHRGSVR